MSAKLLQGGVQQYEWGKLGHDSRVAKAVGRSATHPNEKFAELWVGTHPSLPSTVLDSNNVPSSPLSQFLTENATQYFSKAHQEMPNFANQVPFLLKILSIGKALSIQAHPDKALAEVLHARDPKNYKDPNHKPELIVALTPFLGLCCFRSVNQVKEYLTAIAPLQWVLAEGGLGAAAAVGDTDEAAGKVFLRSVMRALYTAPKEALHQSLTQHQQFLSSQDPTTLSQEDRIFLRLATDYPGDVGCWMVYILNLVSLQPGEGLFLSANEPHAYLEGDGIEVMATSDNVVRAGLTPKFMDVETLLGMLTYSTTSFQEAFRAVDKDAAVQFYQPPLRYRDFSLHRIQLGGSGGAVNTAANVTLPTLGLGLVMQGKGKVNGLQVKDGNAFVCTPSLHVEAEEGTTEPLLVFVASTNTLTNADVKQKL